MIGSELDAAGVHDPDLRTAYRQARTLNAQHGRTFFLATRLLAAGQRPAVHALYGFARMADDILDDFDPAVGIDERSSALECLSTQLSARLAGADCSTGAPVLAALAHTAHRYRIDPQLFDDFLASMRMDLTVTDYPNRAAMRRYTYGSAEVIGLQLLPVLGTVVPAEEAAPYAAALGEAFQLTNFLRDVDEDLCRGRVYLPADELAAHGVHRDLLQWCHTHGRIDPKVRSALAEQHAITRRIYVHAQRGIAMLAPRSRPCIGAALTLYSEILDRIEDSDFAVFSHRATVGTARRVEVAGKGLLRAWGVRLTDRQQKGPTWTTGNT
jgi:phytoene synthase